MSEQVIPNTDSLDIAALAIAWEIVKSTQDIPHMEGNREEKLKKLTEAVINAHKSLVSRKAIF